MLLRLLKRADFITTAKGRRVSADGFILQGKKREPETDIPSEFVRVGFTCSKKIGNSVKRNRAKRRLRALANITLSKQGKDGWDYVIIGKKFETEEILFKTLEQNFTKAIEKIHT